MYAGVINDKTYGGVFVSSDLGRTWKQQSDGLHGDDVFVLAQSDDGTLLAGSSNGIFRWDGSSWTRAGALTGQPAPPPVPVPTRAKARAHRKKTRTEHLVASTKPQDPTQLRGRVSALAVAGEPGSPQPRRASSAAPIMEVPGLQCSPRMQPKPSRAGDYLTMAADGKRVFIGRREGIVASDDNGATWQPLKFPAGLTTLSSLVLTPDGTLWAGGREGVSWSQDHGSTWTVLKRLPVVAVNSLTWDPSSSRLIVTCDVGTVIYSVDPHDQSWTWWNTGWTVHSVASLHGRLAAASLYSGVVVQPAAETTAKTGEAVQDARQ
jgi:photosystem II stability/assembly factor-like uncharacterized protein